MSIIGHYLLARNLHPCDFCVSPQAAWEYPCEDFPIPLIRGHVAFSLGEWYACEHCHDLLHARKIDALIERIVLSRTVTFDRRILLAIVTSEVEAFLRNAGVPVRLEARHAI